MGFNELVQMLIQNGWRLSRTGKSSLRIFVKDGRKPLIVHFHGNAEIPKGTAESTLKKAGLK